MEKVVIMDENGKNMKFYYVGISDNALVFSKEFIKKGTIITKKELDKNYNWNFKIVYFEK